MDYLEQHPWRQIICSPIEKNIAVDIADDNMDWLFLDGEMVKLGSLEHGQLDISQVQQVALALFSKESKDMRILTHLLRTLQHAGSVLDLLLGLQLFADYAEHFWKTAAPISDNKKYRLGVQIIKRFEKSAVKFCQDSSRLEKDAAENLFQKLTALFQGNKLEKDIKELHQRYSLPAENKPAVANNNVTPVATPTTPAITPTIQLEPTPTATSTLEPVKIDTSNDRAWKNTLFKVVEYLLQRDVASPISYQLRRYAMWSGITSLPTAENHKTPLSPPSADLVADYESRLEQPDIAVWQEIEHSLTVSPYWFYGHYLSAQMAEKLGYSAVAKAIKQSLREFVARLPELTDLRFNDETPFFPEVVLTWLKPQQENATTLTPHHAKPLDTDNFETALQQLNANAQQDLKDRFYNQLALAQYFEQQGLQQLAQQNYFSMSRAIEQLSVKEWENSLWHLLQSKLENNQ